MATKQDGTPAFARERLSSGNYFQNGNSYGTPAFARERLSQSEG